MNKIPMLEKFAAQSLVEYDGELIFSKEKFAELIVRECANVCKSMDRGLYKEVDDPTLKDAAVKIRQHFGVEE